MREDLKRQRIIHKEISTWYYIVMYCNKVKHDELDDIVCPFCCK